MLQLENHCCYVRTVHRTRNKDSSIFQQGFSFSFPLIKMGFGSHTTLGFMQQIDWKLTFHSLFSRILSSSKINGTLHKGLEVTCICLVSLERRDIGDSKYMHHGWVSLKQSTTVRLHLLPRVDYPTCIMPTSSTTRTFKMTTPFSYLLHHRCCHLYCCTISYERLLYNRCCHLD